MCDVQHRAWTWVLLIPEALVLLFGAWLCVVGRSIPLEFNEVRSPSAAMLLAHISPDEQSKWIGAALYNVTIVAVIDLLLDEAGLVTRPDSIMLLQSICAHCCQNIRKRAALLRRFHAGYRRRRVLHLRLQSVHRGRMARSR